MKRKKRTEQGQGTVELILTLFAFFTVAFMYVQVALGLGVANYFHYATFMASRAYLSGAATEADQRKAAEATLERMVRGNGKDRFGGVAKGSGDGEIPGSFVGASPRVRLANTEARNTAWEQGVTYKFKVKMYLLPMVPGAKRGRANEVELESQSWLGRDPSEEECLNSLVRRKTISGVGGGDFIYDNGC